MIALDSRWPLLGALAMSTLTVDAHREKLFQLLEQPQPYDFLTYAAAYLDALPDDFQVRLMAIREYVKLGLVTPVRELLETQSLTEDLSAEFEKIRRSLANLPGGTVPFTARARCFELNLAALHERGENTDSIRRAWERGQTHYQLFTDGNGIDQVRTRADGGAWRWVPRLADHRAIEESRSFPEGIEKPMPGPYVFEGLDFGWFFRRLHERTRNTFLGYSCALYVVEPDAALFAMLLHLTDWREIIADPRVFWFIGEDGARRLRQAWDDDPDLPLPQHAFTMSGFRPGCVPSVVEVVQRAIGEHQAAADQTMQRIDATYAPRDTAYWAARFDDALSGRGRPLRVFATVSTHTTYLQYSMRDVKRAFEAMGHEFLLLTEKTSFGVVGRATYHRSIERFDPDLVFVIDHLRAEFPGVLPTRVPYVCWIQDLLPHLGTKEAGRSIGPQDFYVAPELTVFVDEYDYPRSQGLSSPMVTDEHTYSNEPMSDKDLAPYRCDVSYVSSHSKPPTVFHEERRSWFADDPVALALADHLFKAVTRAFDDDPLTACAAVPPLLEKVKLATGSAPVSKETDHSLLHNYLYPLAELVFRQSTLEWVADFCDRKKRTLCLYGNGWEKHPRLKQYARGFARNGPELRAVYQASAVNLQIIGTGAVHQRLLDGLAAGGFFLIRFAPADVLHTPIARLLAAVRDGNLSLDTDYSVDEAPDLVAALKEIWRLRGLSFASDVAQARTSETQRFEAMEAGGFRRMAGAVFDEYEQVSFRSAEEFGRLAVTFLADEPSRKHIAASMRRAVVQHYSYKCLLEELLPFMQQRFAQSARSGVTPCQASRA